MAAPGGGSGSKVLLANPRAAKHPQHVYNSYMFCLTPTETSKLKHI